MAELIQVIGRDPRLHMRADHVEHACGQFTGFAHAVEVRRRVNIHRAIVLEHIFVLLLHFRIIVVGFYDGKRMFNNNRQ